MRDAIRFSRKRVLRLMHEHALLSPHRARQRTQTAHDSHIITKAPNIMWATDATQITTVQDGKVWLFAVAEHWSAELLGWHVAKSSTRFEATRPSAWPSASSSASSPPTLPVASRCDTTTAATSWPITCQKQIRFWGMAPSYAFVREPETNGVIERLFRTLKEQVIHGHVFQTIDQVRHAVRAFAARYNAE